MKIFELGQKVAISDYLVRVSTDRNSLMNVSCVWSGVPTTFLRAPQSAYRSGSTVKMWIPASVFVSTIGRDGIRWNLDDRNNKTIDPRTNSAPDSGIIFRKLILQDGYPYWDDYGSEFSSAHSQVGYQVSYDLSRLPIKVLPSMVTAV